MLTPWNYTFTLAHAWYLVKQRDNFIFICLTIPSFYIDLIILLIYGEQCRLWNSSFYSFILHPAFTRFSNYDAAKMFVKAGRRRQVRRLRRAYKDSWNTEWSLKFGTAVKLTEFMLEVPSGLSTTKGAPYWRKVCTHGLYLCFSYNCRYKKR